MGKQLTPKETAFCEAIISGLDSKSAYRSAYNTDCNDTTANRQALVILNKDHIQQRLQEMRKPLEEKRLIDGEKAREDIINFINSRIDHCRKTEDEQSIIRYVDMLNKIYGNYKADTGPQQEDNKLETINDDLLLKLVDAI